MKKQFEVSLDETTLNLCAAAILSLAANHDAKTFDAHCEEHDESEELVRCLATTVKLNTKSGLILMAMAVNNVVVNAFRVSGANPKDARESMNDFLAAMKVVMEHAQTTKAFVDDQGTPRMIRFTDSNGKEIRL